MTSTAQKPKQHTPPLFVCAVVGYPLRASLSPPMHNAGFRALGLPYTYLSLPHPSFPFLVRLLKEFSWKGFSITIPHKTTALRFADTCDAAARDAGAINTLVQKEGKLAGHNTDVTAIQRLVRRKRKKPGRALIIGAGGAARAACAALGKTHALAISNRTPAKGRKVAARFRAQFLPLSRVSQSLGSFDIILQATPSGSNPSDKPLFDYSRILPRHIVFECVYAPQNTPLVQAARAKGARIIYGYEMLLEQGYEQFRLFTGKTPPKKIMEQTLIRFL